MKNKSWECAHGQGFGDIQKLYGAKVSNLTQRTLRTSQNQNPHIFIIWSTKVVHSVNLERQVQKDKTWECSQRQGFWDIDFLLGTVFFYEPKKVPTKLYQNPHIFKFWSTKVVHFQISSLAQDQSSYGGNIYSVYNTAAWIWPTLENLLLFGFDWGLGMGIDDSFAK